MKIFGIGLSKTGTTSLAQALIALGYRTKDNPGLSRFAKGDLSSIDARLLEDHDALTDTPIPSFYRELDAKYPNAKFILTIRDKSGWLISCKKQFTQRLADKQNEAHNQLFLDLYECTVFDEAKFAAGYDRFVSAVLEHFRQRPDKLLVMNVAAGDGWEKLCPFLGKPIPDVPFPKANVTWVQWMKVTDLLDAAREAGQVLVRTDNLLRAGASKAVRSTSWFGSLGAQIERAYLDLRGGRRYTLERAARAANDLIATFLSKLNPDIPVVSRLSEAPSFEERRKWNHFWLIDPLDGPEGLGTAGGEFSVNIALIEDQRPIYGVVYAPRSETAYYATAGKSALKVIGNGLPAELGTLIARSACDQRLPPASKALRICFRAEGVTGIDDNIADAMEWHSAAAHVVASACGIHVCDGRTRRELTYNKPTFSQDWITVA